MKTSRTFKGASKPFGKPGHFHEPRRHALQAKGIRTGNLANSSHPIEYSNRSKIQSINPNKPFSINKHKDSAVKEEFLHHMPNYEIREYQSQKDKQHHLDIYQDGKLGNSYFWDGQMWQNEKTQEQLRDVPDIIEKEVYGDLEEYEISEQNAYGVKSTYYTISKEDTAPKDDESIREAEERAESAMFERRH